MNSRLGRETGKGHICHLKVIHGSGLFGIIACRTLNPLTFLPSLGFLSSFPSILAECKLVNAPLTHFQRPLEDYPRRVLAMIGTHLSRNLASTPIALEGQV